MLVLFPFVSKDVFYIGRDTYFSTLFGVCPTFRSRITAIYTFLCFLCGFLFAGVRKTQEDTLKVFIYQNTRHAKQQTQGG